MAKSKKRDDLRIPRSLYTHDVDGRRERDEPAGQDKIVLCVGLSVILLPRHLGDRHVVHRQRLVRRMMSVAFGPYDSVEHG